MGEAVEPMGGERQGAVLSRLQRAYAETTEGQRWTTSLVLAGTVAFLLFGLRAEPESQLVQRFDTPPLVTQTLDGSGKGPSLPPARQPSSSRVPPPSSLDAGVPIGDAGSSEDDGEIAFDTTTTTTSPSTTQPPPSEDSDGNGDDTPDDDGGLPDLPIPIP